MKKPISDIKFIETVCECCGNTTDYEARMCRGIAETILEVHNEMVKNEENGFKPEVNIRYLSDIKQLTKDEYQNVLLSVHWGFLEEVDTCFYKVTKKFYDTYNNNTPFYKKYRVIKRGKKETLSEPFNVDYKTTFKEELLKSSPKWENKYFSFNKRPKRVRKSKKEND